MTILELTKYLIFEPCPYAFVCITLENWQYFADPAKYGTFYSRAEMHALIYAYILKRTCAVSQMLEDGCTILDSGLSKTDAPFAAFVEALVINTRGVHSSVRDISKRGPTAMVDSAQIKKAFSIIKDRPMKFKVRLNGVGQTAFFWFKDINDDSGKTTSFDSEWEYVKKAQLANAMHRDEVYMF